MRPADRSRNENFVQTFYFYDNGLEFFRDCSLWQDAVTGPLTKVFTNLKNIMIKIKSLNKIFVARPVGWPHPILRQNMTKRQTGFLSEFLSYGWTPVRRFGIF